MRQILALLGLLLAGALVLLPAPASATTVRVVYDTLSDIDDEDEDCLDVRCARYSRQLDSYYGDLVITGNTKSNSVSVRQIRAGRYRVSDSKDTLRPGRGCRRRTSRVAVCTVRDGGEGRFITPSGNGGNDRLAVLGRLTGAKIYAYGGAGNDTIIANRGDDYLSGGPGNDRIVGLAGDDDINGGAGRDNLQGGDGEDDIDGSTGRDTISGGSQDDEIDAGQDADRITAGGGDDIVEPGSGRDTVAGNAGDDAIEADDGSRTVANDSINGGPGDDTVNYDNRMLPVSVDLAARRGGSRRERDRLTSVENVTGGRVDDTLKGDARANSLNGNLGNDAFDGRSGADIITTGSNRSTSGGVVVACGAGADSVIGVGGDVLLRPDCEQASGHKAQPVAISTDGVTVDVPCRASSLELAVYVPSSAYAWMPASATPLPFGAKLGAAKTPGTAGASCRVLIPFTDQGKSLYAAAGGRLPLTIALFADRWSILAGG